MRVFIVALAMLPVCAAATSSRTDPDTGASTWETQADGVYFGLTQILPDQARAFYVNRGFALEQIEAYASSCVYMTVLRNDSAGDVIHFETRSWAVEAGGKPHVLETVAQWMERLSASEATRPALVAFRWAQFPPRQSYEPGGDWNQGMLSIGLPAGTEFNITARWEMKNKTYQATLNGVRCAQ